MNFIKLIDYSAFFALFVNALLYVPQIVRLIKAKNTQGVSVITFLGFNLINVVIMLHSYLHNDPSIYLGCIASFITNSTATFLIFYYRYIYSDTVINNA